MTKQRIDENKKQIAIAEEYIKRLKENLQIALKFNPEYVMTLRRARHSVRDAEYNVKSSKQDINRFKRKIAEQKKIIRKCEKRIKGLPSLIRSDTKKNIGKVLNIMFSDGEIR